VTKLEAMAAEIDMPPCKFCGRYLYCGGPCCTKSAVAALNLAIGERDHARKLQGRAESRAARIAKVRDAAWEKAFNLGCIVGAACVAWGLAIQGRCVCYQWWDSDESPTRECRRCGRVEHKTGSQWQRA